MTDNAPEREYDPLIDCHDCFFEYVAHCREEQKQGKPLPAIFIPREHNARRQQQ